jgi:hypothetical protein
MIVITAKSTAKTIVIRAKSASIPRTGPENAVSELPSIPPIPPDLASCPKIAPINPIEIMASNTIKNVSKFIPPV